MKLMIEIDNSIYDICKSVMNLPLDENDIMSSLIIQSIANGTPLPKGHGRLIDADGLEVWNGIHAQITAPKGTFEKIWNEADKGDKE